MTDSTFDSIVHCWLAHWIEVRIVHHGAEPLAGSGLRRSVSCSVPFTCYFFFPLNSFPESRRYSYTGVSLMIICDVSGGMSHAMAWLTNKPCSTQNNFPNSQIISQSRKCWKGPSERVAEVVTGDRAIRIPLAAALKGVFAYRRYCLV